MPQAKLSLNGGLVGQTAEENGNLSTPRRTIPSQYPASPKAKAIAKFQSRAPVIIGEAAYTGMMAVEGGLCGQLGVNGGAVDVRQRTRSGYFGSGPELNGELIFKDILRVNGHIAGYVQSHQGTLIVDSMARVDANVEVAIAVIGGVIWTQSIAIQPGAIFEGVCRMLRNEKAVEGSAVEQ